MGQWTVMLKGGLGAFLYKVVEADHPEVSEDGKRLRFVNLDAFRGLVDKVNDLVEAQEKEGGLDWNYERVREWFVGVLKDAGGYVVAEFDMEAVVGWIAGLNVEVNISVKEGRGGEGFS